MKHQWELTGKVAYISCYYLPHCSQSFYLYPFQNFSYYIRWTNWHMMPCRWYLLDFEHGSIKDDYCGGRTGYNSELLKIMESNQSPPRKRPRRSQPWERTLLKSNSSNGTWDLERLSWRSFWNCHCKASSCRNFSVPHCLPEVEFSFGLRQFLSPVLWSSTWTAMVIYNHPRECKQ